MAIELVKHPQLLLMRQPGAVVLHPRHAGFRVDMIRIVGDIGVGEESPQREGKAAIVHRRIFRIVLQPLARVTKVLAKNERFRLCGFCRARNSGDVLKVIPRPARFAEHMHHVQAPAVHIPRRLQPVSDDAVFAAVDFINERWRLEIQLRQARVAQPVQRAALLVKAVPVALRRIRVMTCPAHRLVMPIKPRMRIAAVVEHAVQDQAHPLFLRILTQAQQRLVAAKLRINVAIIFGIVFVYARGFKHRVEVQRRHAQFFQVRQLFADTVEIAAVEGRAARLRG